MAPSILSRIPVVAGVAYKEHVQTLPSSFTASLAAEPDNRYFMQAIAVLANGEKIGYVAPEVAAAYYEAVKASDAAWTCPARRAAPIDHETSGVEVLLDFSALPTPAEAGPTPAEG